MMRQSLLFGFVILSIIAAFSCERPVGQYDSFKRDLDEAKGSFPDSLISHFPRQMKYPASYQPGEYGNPSLFLDQKYEEDALDTLVFYLQTNALATYSADDSCLFVVNRFAHTTSQGLPYNQYSATLDRPASCTDTYLPIPNFWVGSKTTHKTPSRLPPGYTIYVLGAGENSMGVRGQEDWRRYMPENWKSGYTKGVALNKEDGQVIYWTSMW